MAHHASALKAERQSLKRRANNRQNLSKVKTQIKKLRAAIASGDKKTAQEMLNATIGDIDKAAKKGIVHDNAASRYKSRLTRHVNGLTASK